MRVRFTVGILVPGLLTVAWSSSTHLFPLLLFGLCLAFIFWVARK